MHTTHCTAQSKVYCTAHFTDHCTLQGLLHIELQGTGTLCSIQIYLIFFLLLSRAVQGRALHYTTLHFTTVLYCITLQGGSLMVKKLPGAEKRLKIFSKKKSERFDQMEQETGW